MQVLTFPNRKADASLTYFGDPVKASLSFNFWQVESLLNGAADLLDRCVIEQSRFDAVRAQYANLLLAIQAEDDQQRLNEISENKGMDQYAWEDAKQRYTQLVAMGAEADLVRSELASAWTADHYQNRSIAANIHIQELARARWAMEIYFANVEQLRQSPDGDVNSVGGTLGSIAFTKFERTLSRARLAAKKAFMTPGEPLDFVGQANRSENQIARDYAYAIDRLLVASIGLKEIFDYDLNFRPSTPDPISPGTVISVASDWVKDAINWMTKFTQKDQAFTVAVSLRDALKGDWNDLKTGGAQGVSFDVSSPEFQKFAYVRVRGISASSVLASTAPPFFLQCSIRVPSSASIVMPTGVAGQSKLKEIDQRMVPECVLGCVYDLRIPRAPEVCGSVSLMNVSPIASSPASRWSFKLNLSAANAFDQVEDIWLLLNLTGRPL